VIPAAIPAATPAIDVPSPPELAAVPTPAPEPVQSKVRPEEELDLIARGIAKAIAAASAPGLDQQPGRR
jgi:hypothetical protein